MNQMHSRASLVQLFFALSICLLLSSVAEAACLTPPGTTGLESGNQTLSVTVPNLSAFTELHPIHCAGDMGFVDPGVTPTGAGRAEFVSSSLGYRARTSSNVGGQGSGSGGATVAGSVRYLIRATSGPGYSGPTTVDVSVSMQFDVGGDVTVSGVGSAGGAYQTNVSLRPANSQIGIQLFIGAGSLAAGGTVTLENSTPIDIDQDYILQIAHLQNVTTSFAQGGMGQVGSAASSGEVAISFESEFVLPVSQLTIEYPMVDLLGVPAPSLGNPPQFPTNVPLGSAVPAALLVVLSGTAVAMSRRRIARALRTPDPRHPVPAPRRLHTQPQESATASPRATP